MQAYVDAAYLYHWTPLIGCLAGQLSHLGLTHPSEVIGAATGICCQPPDADSLPDGLADGLTALGASAAILHSSTPGRWRRWRWRHRVRRELRDGRAVTAFGAGVSAFGPTWGLIVGLDDERRAWRRDGPMTEQVSPWLPTDELDAADRLTLIALRRSGQPDDDAIHAAADRAFSVARDDVRTMLDERLAALESDAELPPQRHAHEVQTLAASWGEAAAFWRARPHSEHTPASQAMALALSRYATLFPYPMGGQPNDRGVRAAAAAILREARDALEPRPHGPR